jgi:hypothetical protein
MFSAFLLNNLIAGTSELQQIVYIIGVQMSDICKTWSEVYKINAIHSKALQTI